MERGQQHALASPRLDGSIVLILLQSQRDRSVTQCLFGREWTCRGVDAVRADIDDPTLPLPPSFNRFQVAQDAPQAEREQTIGRDTKGAKTRFTAPAYGKFESSSLQRRVQCEPDFVPHQSSPGMREAILNEVRVQAARLTTRRSSRSLPMFRAE